MSNEFKINNDIREMLEKTYRLIYEQIDNQWQYYPASDVQDEVKKRQIIKQGATSVIEGEEGENQVDQLRDI